MARPWNRTDFDGAWKEALERYLRPFLALCFPPVEAGIDWSRPMEFVDKELPALQRGCGGGRKYVDKLVQVYAMSGRLQRVLVHVEVQTQPHSDLPARLYEYHRRLTEVRRLPVVTLAVLADSQPSFKAEPFECEMWGCRVRFEYPACKLLELDEGILRRDGSAIGRFILAHRAAQQTVRDPRARLRLKLAIIEEACSHHGFSEAEIGQLLSVVDKVTTLPEKKDQELVQELQKRQGSHVMPYITSFERHGIRKGLRKGRREGRLEALRESVKEALEARFGGVSLEIGHKIDTEGRLEILRQWHRIAVTAPSAEVFGNQIETLW